MELEKLVKGFGELNDEETRLVKTALYFPFLQSFQETCFSSLKKEAGLILKEVMEIRAGAVAINILN